jgi:hypothetical protein
MNRTMLPSHPDTAARRHAGVTKVEWILIVLVVVIAGYGLVSMQLQSEERRRHMESVAIPLIEALDRYRVATKSYPDNLQKLVPTYLQELPGCNPGSASSGMAYNLDSNSGEYYLNCGIGMFAKRQYSSKTKAWNTWD